MQLGAAKLLYPLFKYIWITIKHKFYVFIAGFRLRVPMWRIITHDMSKFRLSELPHYAQQFYSDYKEPDKWAACWLKHQNRNDHHWEYWIPRTTHSTEHYPDEPLPMPEVCVREMIADWMAAGKAYQGEWPDTKQWEWLQKNIPNMRLHPKTKERITDILAELNGEKDEIEKHREKMRIHSLKIDVAPFQNKDDIVVLSLGGSIDSFTIKKVVDEGLIILNTGCKKLVVDFGNVTFLGGSALQTFIEFSRQAKEKKGWMRAACVPPYLRNRLCIIFDNIYESVDTAATAANPLRPGDIDLYGDTVIHE